MTKQELTALNMAGFIKSQTLILLDKLNKLNLDDCSDEMSAKICTTWQKNFILI
ncbi:Regulatory protein rop [Arsenophonus endosymbiont of Bemisia tabaci Q2]|nr:Regulatory protein rop [Arsenophonus endosymbiont of Bemisia tabaci Q2]